METMCIHCWEDEGRPYELTDAVRAWTKTFADTNKFGAMHIVVEDWNLDDESIGYCRYDNRVTESELSLCNAMLAMREGERWALAINADEPDFARSLAIS